MTRHVHVAETDARARAEAEPNLLLGYIQGGELIARTRVGFGPPDLEATERSTPERQDLRRVFQECTKSYDFWIENGLALVGSPDTVIRQIESSASAPATTSSAPDTGLATWHRSWPTNLRLFAEHVIPAFA